MSELLNRHVEQVAIQVGRLLRGFEDAAVHVGGPVRFAREFRMLLERPALHVPDADGPVSYVEALATRGSSIPQGDAIDAVGILAKGLAGPRSVASAVRVAIPAEDLRRDLTTLLREPVLRFFLHVPDRTSFFEQVEKIGEKRQFALVKGSRESRWQCPVCDRTVVQEAPESAFHCSVCRRRFETFVALPMVSAVLAVVSFDMLHEVVGLDGLVHSYQEHSGVHPLDQMREGL